MLLVVMKQKQDRDTTNHRSRCHSLTNDNEWELDNPHLDMSEA